MNRPIIPFYRNKYSRKHTSPPILEITTMIGCPLMCSFCPQKTLKKNYKKQDKKYHKPRIIIDNYKKIIRFFRRWKVESNLYKSL